MGLVLPTSGRVTVLGARCRASATSVLHRMNFESPYVDMPMRLTVRQNLKVFGRLYGVPDIAGAHRRARRGARPRRSARPADRQALGRTEDARVARQGADQPPEVLLLDEPTASLDPDTADWVRGRLEHYRAAAQRHHPARLAQHGRGRAHVRARHHDEAGQDRRRRHAGATARALRPHQSRGGVPRRRARPRRSAARRRNEQRRSPGIRRVLAAPRSRAMVLRYWYLLRRRGRACSI